MEILKIKLNEKQPIAQQIYLTEESDYGLAIQIDDLQSQGPETITFNGSQITSEKDKVADYNLFKLKTPKYDKTQNKYLIEIPDTDGSVTYKITVNIIQSETVYQDNGDNSSVELPEWTENIDGDTDFIYMKKNDVKLTTADLVVNFLGSTDPALSVGNTSTYIKRGGNEFIVNFDDLIGIKLNNNDGDKFNINQYGPSIHTEINDINFSSNSGDIILSSSSGSININACGRVGEGLRANVDSFCICDNNNNLILSGGRNSNTYIVGRDNVGNKSSILIDDSISLDGKSDININVNDQTILSSDSTQTSLLYDNGNTGVFLGQNSLSIDFCGTTRIEMSDGYNKISNGRSRITLNGNNVGIDAQCNINLNSKETQLSSDNIEICGTNLKIYNSNIVVENNTSVTNAQLGYLFQIAKKLTPENLPNVLEVLGLNT